ncbi:ral guanine nucleotide dissociation stimulator-like [Canis lupus dingo]|uniref:ral guanine nucleotide dissociation stimulator-like n=1 Tax=Canis lupus dingo TaxID=286419 RepID=UPI000DC6CCD4|nr:ral guanine nucleotide dissociation stimulator-like [Canis lupus dingo]
MFSCCLLTSGGSGSQEPQGCGLFQCCRHWLQNKYQRIWAFIRRRLPSCTRVVGCEQEEGVICPTASRSREVPCAANGGQRGLRGAVASAWMGHRIVPANLSRTDLLELEVRQLLPALQRREVISIFTFLYDYRGFATTDEVLDLLFTEYGCIVAACGDNDADLQRWKLAICYMLKIWLDYYREDFCQLPEFPSLRKLLEFLRQHMPGSDVEVRALRHLRQFRRLHAAEPEAGASAGAKHPESALEAAPAPTAGPAAPSGPGGIEAVLAAWAEGSARAAVPAGEAEPLQVVVTAEVHRSALGEPPAPLGALGEEQAPAPALEVVDVPEPPPNSMEQPASGPEPPVEPPQEPAPALAVWPAASGPELIELDLGAGEEDLVKAEMLAPEAKVVHVLVEPMIPRPDEEEPPAPAATPEE